MKDSNEANVIILRSVFKITDCWMEPSIDPMTKRFSSVVRKVTANGDAILTDEDIENRTFFIKETDAIRLYDGIRFNLDDEYEGTWWEAIKFSPKIAKERSAKDAKGNYIIDGDGKRYGRAEFYIERPGKESKTRISHKKLVHDAQAYIWDDDSEGVYTKAKLLGTKMDLAPFSDVQEFLLNRAAKDPQEIIDIYTDQNIGLRILLLDAKDRYVIRHKDGGFMYGEIILGYTTDSVLSFFKNPKNVRIYNSIKAEVYPSFETNNFGQMPENMNESDKSNVSTEDFVHTPHVSTEEHNTQEVVTLGKKPIKK